MSNSRGLVAEVGSRKSLLLVLLVVAAARIVSYLVARTMQNHHRTTVLAVVVALALLCCSVQAAFKVGDCAVVSATSLNVRSSACTLCGCVCGCAWELALGRTSWRSPNTVMQAALCLRRWHRTPRSTSRLSLERRLAWVARTTGSRSRSTTTYVHRTCRSRQQRRGGAHSMARAEELWLRGRLVLDQGLVR